MILMMIVSVILVFSTSNLSHLKSTSAECEDFDSYI